MSGVNIMNNETWIRHLEQWKHFLEIRLSEDDEPGNREKMLRQLTAIERVRFAAVLNPELLIEFIDPPQSIQDNYGESIDFCLSLNDSQKKAVNNAVLSESNLSIIQGPPGTGKTQVIAEICLQLYRRNPNIRILVCSETHVAVNTLIKRIAEHEPSIRLVRIRDKEKADESNNLFSPEIIVNDYFDWLQSNCNNKDIVNIIEGSMTNYEDKGLEKALALSSNVVGMTCNRVGAYRFLNSTEMFDYAIIDEVCKATLPEILMPLSVAQKAVLVGDPKQLPPVFCSEDIEIIKSIDNCNLQQYMYIDTLFERYENKIVLDTQYRMENNIGAFISDTFYKGTIKNGRDVALDDSLIWIDYSPSRKWPQNHNIMNGKPVIYNLEECKIVVNELNNLEKEAAQQLTVAVIVPYRQQVIELKKVIPAYERLIVSIDTVDGFQGKESDVVIFGVTRTTGPFRFLADERRLNVALSRARNKIIIIGSRQYTTKHTLLERVCDSCKLITAQMDWKHDNEH